MPYVLPSKYRFSHHFAIALHDLIVEKVKAGIEARVFDVELDAAGRDWSHAPRSGTELYEWIEHNYGPETTLEMDRRLTVRALLVDFCHFVLEALRASAKGKTTVAFALLRKPFKDNLFYLEWILADPADFFTRFRGSGPKTIEVGSLGPQRRLEIIRKSISAAGGIEHLAEFIHELRYDRSKSYGLAGTWDKATHLLTLNHHIRTEERNFNFVFSSEPAVDTQWLHLYGLVPLLLHHAVDVTDAHLARLAQIPEDYQSITRVRRVIGFTLWAREMHMVGTHGVPALAELEALFSSSPIHCDHCGAVIPWHDRNKKSFALRGSLRCSSCRSTVSTDDT